jgi:hypothetical protein
MTPDRHTIFSSFIRSGLIASFAFVVLWSMAAFAADTINGQVFGGGAPIVGSTVTLWAASASAPRQIAQTQTDANGRFTLSSDAAGADLYLVAKGGRPTASAASGDNPAIALMSALGSTPPTNVVINEMTTVASVWRTRNFWMALPSRAIHLD